MGQINRIPLGYLDMLQSQTGGKNPFDASESVVPVVEMSPFYQMQHFGGSVHVGNSAPVNTVNQLIVPQGVVWFLHGSSYFWTAIAPLDSASFRMVLRNLPQSGSALIPIHMFQTQVAIAIGDRASDSILFPNLIPLQGGTQINWHVESNTGGNRSTQFHVSYYEFKVG